MTNKNQTQTYSADGYLPAAAGLYILRQQDLGREVQEVAARESMGQLEKSLDLGEDGKLAFGLASEKQLPELLQLYAGKYEKQRGETSISDLTERYQEKGLFEKFYGEKSDGAKAEILKHSSMTYNELSKTIEEAQRTAQNKYGDKKEEDIEKAKKTLEKYGIAYNAIMTFENYLIENNARPYIDGARKKQLQSIIPDEPKEKQVA